LAVKVRGPEESVVEYKVRRWQLSSSFICSKWERNGATRYSAFFATLSDPCCLYTDGGRETTRIESVGGLIRRIRGASSQATNSCASRGLQVGPPTRGRPSNTPSGEALSDPSVRLCPCMVQDSCGLHFPALASRRPRAQ
jgi:hypothetical protein